VAKTSRSKKPVKKKSNHTEVSRSLLMDQREQIMSLYEHDLKVGQTASDEGTEDIVDRANNSYNREFMFALSDTERQILLEIDEAIERLDNGNYGTCLNCEESIPRARLKAVPWTRYCIDCQEQAEQGIAVES
jgi:DnaK suppressor protein